MQTTALQYKLIKKIKDDRFDEDLIDQYDLLIHVGTRDLQVGVIDAAEERMLQLEDYVFPNLTSHEDLLQVLDQLFDSHPFLRAAFWKSIKISVKNNKFVQVPEVLFVEDAMQEYLKFNAHIDTVKESVHAARNPGSQAVTVFALPEEIREWFCDLYPNRALSFMHQSAVLIEGVTRYSASHKENPLYIYVDRFKLHILSCRQGKLIYYNQFQIRQFSDYVKYIMLVLKSLQLNQQTSQVMLWGYIGKNSPHYHEFYKYIRNVTFGTRPDFLHFSYMFDEVQDHHFFDLYNMHLIGD